MTVLFHSGTRCPVIGSECVLSAVSLQDVLKTLVRLSLVQLYVVMNHIIQQRGALVVFFLHFYVCQRYSFMFMTFLNLAYIPEQMPHMQADLVLQCQLGQ